MNRMGFLIAELRKCKGTTQEELAKYVVVSAQAVSKWENGGLPDTELLPKIADFFEISIDCLFGRETPQPQGCNASFIRRIMHASEEERFKIAFEYCWDIERALGGNDFDDEGIAEYEKRIEKTDQHYSSMMFNRGFTRMGLANRMQYFLLVPEIENKDAALFDQVDYCELFEQLSDRDVFKTLIFLNKRENDKSFTPKLLESNIKVSEEKAKEIIGRLKKYHLISSTFIEIDDEVHEIFSFKPTPSFIALLIFAHEMICKPNCFSYCYECRTKPYLA